MAGSWGYGFPSEAHPSADIHLVRGITRTIVAIGPNPAIFDAQQEVGLGAEDRISEYRPISGERGHVCAH